MTSTDLTSLDNENVDEGNERKWEQAFLTALTTSPNVSGAAKAAGVTRQRVYQVRSEDPAFAKRWDDAVEEATDALEGRAYKLALDGETPVLTIFMLKSRRRAVYGDVLKQEVDQNVNVQGAVQFYIPTNGREQRLLTDGSE
jgi:hypothetical protein